MIKEGSMFELLDNTDWISLGGMCLPIPDLQSFRVHRGVDVNELWYLIGNDECRCDALTLFQRKRMATEAIAHYLTKATTGYSEVNIKLKDIAAYQSGLLWQMWLCALERESAEE